MIELLGSPSEKSIVSGMLDNIIKEIDIDGVYYRGFPILASSEGKIKLDGLLCSPNVGVVIFHFIEGRDIDSEFEDIVDEVHLKIMARLQEVKELTINRQLNVPITSITYGPMIPPSSYNDIQENILLCREKSDITNKISESSWLYPELFSNTLSRLQSLSNLNRRRIRGYVEKKTSKGAVLKDLENKLATLDINQTRAVLENIDGVQRIRGLAGSGKTIVLARKIAHIHTQNPHWKIAVTFNSRSLKEQLTRLIEIFYSDSNNGELPDLEKIKVIHAWGSPTTEGMYYNACLAHNTSYYDFSQSKSIKKSDEDHFQAVCRTFLEDKKENKQLYDLILVDEAQDFSPDFLRLCYDVLPDSKRLIYAYDELQNLGDSSMPSPEEIWGSTKEGTPVVSFDKKSQDIILDVCYRNPGPILTTAHALGFGIYRKPMIQMFDYPELWSEIGYDVTEGKISEGKNVTLTRSDKSSPSLLTGHNTPEELLVFKKFDSSNLQATWVAEQIEENINEEEILPSDIVVIHPNALNLRQEVGELRKILFEKKINSSIAGITSSPDEFFSDNTVTFTSIYRAKGNEAAVVYIINAEHCNSPYELAKKRNILFTAMTRTKAWLRVCGKGNYFDGILDEYKKVLSNNFTLNFTYPTEEERKKMQVVNRDMTSSERMKVNSAKRNAENLALLLDSEVNIEDLPEELREQLIKKLMGDI